MNDNIGQPGQNVNLSVASRAMNVEPDKEQIEQYDERPAQANSIQIVFIIVACMALAPAIYYLKNGSWALGAIGIFSGGFLAMLAYSSGKATVRKEIAYSGGLIVPAIITNTNPIELIALADMRVAENQTPVYGCLKMRVKSLPNHKIEIGEKVPCVSMFVTETKGTWRHFEPRPVCWGYKNPDLIPVVIQSISEDSDGGDEWQMLHSLKDQMANASLDVVVFFDSDSKPVEV